MTSYLAVIQAGMVRYGMTTYLTLGNIGNLLSIVIFSKKTHRQNPCSLYLWAASIINIIGLNLGIIPLVYALDHPDPLPRSLNLCKWRQYFLHAILMIDRNLIVLACMDRFAVSSDRVSVRNWSTIRLARRCTAGVILFWLVISIHIIIFQDIQNGVCGMFGAYSLAFSIYSIIAIGIIAIGIIPPSMMIVFGILTWQNLKQIHLRAVVFHHRDRQLLSMLSAEVVVYLRCTALNPGSILYTTLSNNIPSKSLQRFQIESFINFIIRNFLIYIFHAAPFYIYFTFSSSFRKECKQQFIFWKRPRVEPRTIRNQ